MIFDEKFTSSVLQGLTIALIVAAIMWYMQTKFAERNLRGVTGPSTQRPTYHASYMPLLGSNVYTVRGTPVYTRGCSLECTFAPAVNRIPLSTDYLCCVPSYVPAVSEINLASNPPQICGDGLVYRAENGTSFPIDGSGIVSTPQPIKINGNFPCANCCIPSTATCACCCAGRI
jgi:hypothetical protein